MKRYIDYDEWCRRESLPRTDESKEVYIEALREGRVDPLDVKINGAEGGDILHVSRSCRSCVWATDEYELSKRSEATKSIYLQCNYALTNEDRQHVPSSFGRSPIYVGWIERGKKGYNNNHYDCPKWEERHDG